MLANDSTIKAGSWGKRTVEKMIRIQETAEKLNCPLLYLVDSAGARITDQLEMFPGRRGAGRIFYNQVKLSEKFRKFAYYLVLPRGWRLYSCILRYCGDGRRECFYVFRISSNGRNGYR